jgi:hypothetical protein
MNEGACCICSLIRFGTSALYATASAVGSRERENHARGRASEHQHRADCGGPEYARSDARFCLFRKLGARELERAARCRSTTPSKARRSVNFRDLDPRSLMTCAALCRAALYNARCDQTAQDADADGENGPPRSNAFRVGDNAIAAVRREVRGKIHRTIGCAVGEFGCRRHTSTAQFVTDRTQIPRIPSAQAVIKDVHYVCGFALIAIRRSSRVPRSATRCLIRSPAASAGTRSTSRSVRASGLTVCSRVRSLTGAQAFAGVCINFMRKKDGPAAGSSTNVTVI